MALTWFHDWGILMASTVYQDAGWTVTNTANVTTDYTSNLKTPTGGGLTPTEQARLYIDGTSYIGTPALTAFDEGWFVSQRYELEPGGVYGSGATSFIMGIFDSATERIFVQPSNNGATSTTLDLDINGTTVATSVTTIDVGDEAAIAVQFDLSLSPPQAGLYIDGVEAIAMTAAASGSAVTADRMRLSSGSAGREGSHGCVYLLTGDRTGDLALGSSTDVWSSTFNLNAISGDTNWSIFGGGSVKADELSDNDEGTGVETTTDPDSIVLEFEGRSDVLSGWAPSVIYGVNAIVLASADVLTSVTVTLNDGAGDVGAAEAATLTSVQDFVVKFSNVNNAAGSWTGAQLDAINVTYAVSS